MKLTKHICCGALALLLALGMAACTPLPPDEAGATPTPGEGTPPAETTATPEPSAQPTESVTLEPAELVETEDVVQRLLGFSRDTALLTVNGVPVTAEDYLYCLSYATENICGYFYSSMSDVDWTISVGTKTLQDYVTESAMETAAFYSLIRSKAAENGVMVSDADREDLDVYIAQVIASLGGTDQYILRLQMLGMSDEGFRAMNEVSLLYDGLEKTLFGSQNPSDEVLAAFAEETADALLAKHILIKTVDDDNQPLPEEEQAAAKAKAEELLAQLRASDDPLALFDQLMNEYSQDGRYEDGTLAAPDGYLFGPGYMVEAFEEGTRALEYNEISGLVESEFGYHIILRLPPVNDEVREGWISTMMNNQVDEWIDTAQVETTKEFSQVGPQSYYELLEAYRTELAASADEVG